MNIVKIINNSIVLAKDQHGYEFVVMGKGLGFSKKIGQDICDAKIEKIFRMENDKEMEDFKNLITKLPAEYLQLTNQIILYTKNTIGLDLNENIFLTLTDHINFAVERYQKGMHFPNALYEEIRMFYPKEFLVGKKALELIEEKIKIRLPEDEAASIALHIVNAEYHGPVGNAVQMTTMIREIIEMINVEYPSIQLLSDETCSLADADKTIQKNWLISNVKYLVHRLLKLPEKQFDMTMYKKIIFQYFKQEYLLVEKISQLIKQKYNCNMTTEEEYFLALIINRINLISAN